ncbi:MAG: cation diffusion facilitator family transporter [Gammaproteobacteria bacterium]|nr:cation diffusion facilitator family transporter [Gammaproteobacteria bacterium]MBU2478436.1 cation diffusion facilitator family transporter [Gammaproteobacteria bacterium]
MDANPTEHAGHPRYLKIRRVTLVGAVINAVLATIKLMFGYLAHSQALIADGLHSVSDLASDFLLLFAAKHASRDADEDHPYGHGRIETLFGIVQGSILGVFALGIAYDAGQRLFDPARLLQPESFALIIALVSVLAKEGLYHYTIRAARKLRSNMLRGNAWDHRSDAISSVIVMVGVAGTLGGLPYLDALAAIGVALMILKISWALIWQSVRELIDTALDAEKVEKIRGKIMHVGGVERVHMLRTRTSGRDALVDVHIQVDPALSVSEGHHIGEKVRDDLIAEIEEVADVTVHIDPEDDETASPCDHLPLREEILPLLRESWRSLPAAESIEDIGLHYLDGEIHVDLVLPLECAPDRASAEALMGEFQRLADAVEGIGAVRLLYR